MFQLAITYLNIFQSETLKKFPKLGFLVCKQTIWQPRCETNSDGLYLHWSRAFPLLWCFNLSNDSFSALQQLFWQRFFIKISVPFFAMQCDQVRFWKSRPKCSPINFCVKNYITLYYSFKSPISCATSVIFTKTNQSKQSPIRRKFAQSGHPVTHAVWTHF
jgi:hypothetical protein